MIIHTLFSCSIDSPEIIGVFIGIPFSSKSCMGTTEVFLSKSSDNFLSDSINWSYVGTSDR